MTYRLAISFITGILLARFISLTLPPLVLPFVGAGLATVAFLFRREPFIFNLSTCVLLLMAGVWRYQLAASEFDPAWVGRLNDGSRITQTGQVASAPEVSGSKQRLEVDNLRLTNSQTLRGRLLVKAYRYPEYQYGDEIKITGRLKAPPEFEKLSGILWLVEYPKMALLSSGKGNRIYKALLDLRRLLEERIGQILPEPESSLLAGVLLGAKRALPPDFYTALQKSGTLHVVVVSGTNITYAIAALLALGGFLKRPARITLATLGVLAYALMVGGGSAVWRATLMGLAVLLAAVLGRRRIAKEALFLSAAVLLLANPLSLWQIGFQLSFAATSCIIFLQDPLGSKLQALPPLLRSGLVTTLAAQIGVLPVLIHNFQAFSVIAPLANLLTFLLVPLITVIGAIVSFAALLFLPLGHFLAPLVYIPAKLFVIVVELSAKAPLAQVIMPKLPVGIWAFYYLPFLIPIVKERGLEGGSAR